MDERFAQYLELIVDKETQKLRAHSKDSKLALKYTTSVYQYENATAI